MTGLRIAFLCVLFVMTKAKLPLEDATAVVDQLFTYQFDPSDFPADTNIQVSVHRCIYNYLLIPPDQIPALQPLTGKT